MDNTRSRSEANEVSRREPENRPDSPMRDEVETTEEIVTALHRTIALLEERFAHFVTPWLHESCDAGDPSECGSTLSRLNRANMRLQRLDARLLYLAERAQP